MNVDASAPSLSPEARGRVRRPVLVWVLAAALLFQGVAALGGGIPLLLDPSGDMLGLSTDELAGTPVSTYLLPGLLLTVPLGLVPLVDSWALIRQLRPRWAQLIEEATGRTVAWLAALAVGIGLVLWIVVEYLLIGYQWLQVVFGLLGIVIVILALLPQSVDMAPWVHREAPRTAGHPGR